MRKALNILFLGGAKRVAMGKMFIDAGRKLGVDVNLFSYELSAEVPLAAIATIVKGMRWNDPMLMDDLHRVVEENRIDMMIPFVDPAVEVAAEYCSSDSECCTPLMNGDLGKLLFDKIKADALFRELGFPLPANAMIEHVEGQVIAKPRFGSASKGIQVLEAAEFATLRGSREFSDNYLVQEYIAKRVEYTVDCYVSSRGEMVCAVPRERIEVQGGEVSVTETVRDSEMEHESARILKALAITGPVTLQFMRERDASGALGRLMLMEINPRLGGGAVCAVHAGADIPQFIIRDMAGENVAPCDNWRAGVRICRYPQEVVFDNGRLMPR